MYLDLETRLLRPITHRTLPGDVVAFAGRACPRPALIKLRAQHPLIARYVERILACAARLPACPPLEPLAAVLRASSIRMLTSPQFLVANEVSSSGPSHSEDTIAISCYLEEGAGSSDASYWQHCPGSLEQPDLKTWPGLAAPELCNT